MKLQTKVLLSVIYSSILALYSLILGIFEIAGSLGLHTNFAPADIMGGFSLIIASSLILYGAKNTVKLLYDGLSFYLVGLALLIAIGLLNIIIALADLLDYYILCIGENCSGYSAHIRPEIYIFFLALLGLYPFFVRWHFRRKVP